MVIPIVDAIEDDVGRGERELAIGDGVDEVAGKLKQIVGEEGIRYKVGRRAGQSFP